MQNVGLGYKKIKTKGMSLCVKKNNEKLYIKLYINVAYSYGLVCSCRKVEEWEVRKQNGQELKDKLRLRG